MSKFECYCYCESEECSRFHKPPIRPCNCIRQLSKSTKFIERILDISQTIVRVLIICKIHECKAKAAADVIMFAFLHYDIVPDPVCDVLRKKLRRDDVFYDLGRKCRMNRLEAQLAYSLIKRAFKAFYYKQTADAYALDFADKCQWIRAAERSAETYANAEGLSKHEKKKLEDRITLAYCSYVDRVHAAAKEPEEVKPCTCDFMPETKRDDDCPCCFCSKHQGRCFRVFAHTTRAPDDREECEFKKRMIEEGKLYAYNTPDPCGHKQLEWQTKEKEAAAAAATTRTCGCEGDGPRPDECCCGEDPCVCEPLTNDITVEWEPVPLESPRGTT